MGRDEQTLFCFSLLLMTSSRLDGIQSSSFQSFQTQIVTGSKPRYIIMKCLEKCTSPCPTMNVHKWLHFVTGLGNKKANAFETGNGYVSEFVHFTCVSVVLDSGKKKINVVGMPESRTQIILVVPRATQLFQCCFVTNEGHVTKRNQRALVKMEFGFGELF